MAVRWAVANGLWSNTATWDGGTLPSSADDVHADGKTVTIDQNVTVLSLRTTARSSGTVGGLFIANNGVTITSTSFTAGVANAAILTLATGAVVTVNGTFNTATQGGAIAYSSGSLTINGGVYGAAPLGSNCSAITVTGTGSLTINGDVGGGSNTGGVTVVFNSTGAFNITGNVSTWNANGCLNITGAASLVTIVGQVSSGGVGPPVGCNSATTISITGTLVGGAGTVVSTSNGIVNIIGTVNGTSAAAPVIVATGNNASNTVILSGPIINSSTGGVNALYCQRLKLMTSFSQWWELRDNSSLNGASVRLYTASQVGGNPAPSNVRFSTVYGPASELTGTLRVPPASSVASGVPVDATTGTAALSPADVAALVGAQIAAALNSTP